MLFPYVVGGIGVQQYDSAAAVLLDRIALGEGTSDAAAQEYGFNSGYDVLYGYNTPEDFDSKFSGKSLTEMTLGEIWELQEKMGIKNAVGKYQILSDTLFGTKKMAIMAYRIYLAFLMPHYLTLQLKID